MRDFSYSRATTAADAIAAAQAGARYLAGGTTLVDLMKCGVAEPDALVDITRLPGLDQVTATPDGVRIGALARMAHVAEHPLVMHGFPAVAQALHLAASQQLRNMATIAGNLMQRTRCSYFREPAAYRQCNKRDPGSGCAALNGVNRGHAILGASDQCIATYPGDLAVALVAVDAVVRLADGRAFAADDFFLPYADAPHREHPVLPSDLIVAVEVPTSAAARRSHYLKVRDRESYEFAAASAAVALELEPDGRTVRDVRIALGGVATKPWRARAAELELIGRTFDEPTVRAACARTVDGAVGRGANDFKITLGPRVAARALMAVGGL